MNFPKEEYIKAMAENLPSLRMRLGLNQDELAELVGSSRQMLSLIERGVRPMMWSTFLSMLYVFRSNEETREMMAFLGIYTDELANFLNISPQAGLKRTLAAMKELGEVPTIKRR